MKVLVVYDSVHGNTEKIANAIAESISEDVTVQKASESGPDDLNGVDLLIVGSPTYGGRPTDPMKAYLERVETVSLEGINIACFDTRIPSFWVKIFGFAGSKIDKSLSKHDGLTVMAPEGFFVKGTEGPLVDKEIERAKSWANKVWKAAAF